MDISSFFEGFGAGIVCFLLFVGLSVRTVIKHKEYYVPKMMNAMRTAMVKRANNAGRKPASTGSTSGGSGRTLQP